MAHQLRAAGQDVATLALLDTEVLTLRLAEGSIGARLRHWAQTVKINLRYASRMGGLEFLARKSSNVRMRSKLLLWGILAHLGIEIQPEKLSAEEGFLLAMRRYVPRPYPGDATLFRAGDGSDYPEPKLGWEGLIGGHLDIQQVSGDHDTILQEPHIGMLARLLEGCLENPPRREVQEPGSAKNADNGGRIVHLTPAIELGKP
jgi:thioesterase domain-containing protein